MLKTFQLCPKVVPAAILDNMFLNKIKTKNLLVIRPIWIFLTFLLLAGTGCIQLTKLSVGEHEKTYHDVMECPVGKREMSTEESLKLMRKNLESIARHFPNQKLNGQVIFKEGISIDSFVSITERYNVGIGESSTFGESSIQLLVDDSVTGVKMEPAHLTQEGFAQYLKQYESEELTPYNTTIINFHAATTAEEFLKLWQENEDTIRGVGVGCTTLFYIVRPSDPIKFRSPDLLN